MDLFPSKTPPRCAGAFTFQHTRHMQCAKMVKRVCARSRHGEACARALDRQLSFERRPGACGLR